MIVTLPNRPGRPSDGNVSRRRDKARGRTVGHSAKNVELDRAAALLEARRGGIVWRAEPGMGKSATLDRVVDHLQSLPAGAGMVLVRLASGSATERGAAVTSIVAQVQQATGVTAPSWMCSTATLTGGEVGPAGVVVALSDYLAGIQDAGTVVLVADDLDLIDPSCVTVLLGLVARRTRGLVLLGTITGERELPGLTFPVEVRDVPPLGPADALDLLWSQDELVVAPHVAARLVTALGGNAAAVEQVAHVLTSDQLAGWSSLPDPLPVVPATRIAAGSLDALDALDRHILLVAAVATARRTEVLLAACGVSADELVARPAARHLELLASRFAFVDPRVRSIVHGDASLAERSAAHLALARVHAAAGDEDATTWHAALATIEGDPTSGPPLVDLAARLLRDGDADSAFDVAREAASHCTGEGLDSAVELIVRSALHAGYVVDAAAWGRGGMRASEGGVLGHAVGSYLTAITLTDGQVPDEMLERAAQQAAGAPERIPGVVVGAACAAVLHSERADGPSAQAALALAERLAADLGDDLPGRVAEILHESWAVCEVFGVSTEQGRRATRAEPGTGRRQTRVRTRAALALLAAMQGNLTGATTSLASALSELAPVGGGAGRVLGDRVSATVLEEAELWVAKALVDTWSGRLTTARSELADAAYRLPVALPLAGLGAALARRLDILVTGSVGRLAAALEDVVPGEPSLPMRHASLGDRALLAVFEHEPAQAATLLELADEREIPRGARLLPLPGEDEVAVWYRAQRRDAALLAAPRARARAEALPGEMGRAAHARLDVLLGGADEILAATERAAELSRSLASSFERGRTELVVGRALVDRGDEFGGSGHLFSALELFRDAGATAWSSVVLADLAAVEGADIGNGVGPGGVAPGVSAASGVSAPELAEQLRRRWSGILTERELDVALLVVEGSSNREVAETLFVSVRTVEVHLGRVFRKLGVRSRLELTVLAHRGATAAGE